jgi:hypothetical protein
MPSVTWYERRGKRAYRRDDLWIIVDVKGRMHNDRGTSDLHRASDDHQRTAFIVEIGSVRAEKQRERCVEIARGVVYRSRTQESHRRSFDKRAGGGVSLRCRIPEMMRLVDDHEIMS